ncbi:hypothetical protein [Photobacterium leiognathi]|uniref:hypothetical protein n=1 Tax=Photobacterium leiognathi TaxID=553611 RepID=UPI002980F71A|nr:hypothetical protein [Photobacterium leiognathi]
MLNKLKSLVQFYEDNYRHESLERFQFYEAYSFNGNVKINNIYIKNIWPESWEIGNTKGIYAIFHHEELLYIGKASQQPIGKRLSAHFQHSEDKSYAIPTGVWSKDPTHFVAWGVPDDSFFEASSLEEFLIHNLKKYLPDNTVGKLCY